MDKTTLELELLDLEALYKRTKNQITKAECTLFWRGCNRLCNTKIYYAKRS